MRAKFTLLLTPAILGLAACNNAANTENGANDMASATATAEATGQPADAQNLVNEAVQETQKMKADPQLAKLLSKAKGVYLVPEFGRGALIVGGKGGAGMVLANMNGKWSPPAFFNFGSLSVGAQAGGSGGQIAFILMSDDALNAFMSGNKVTLNAGSGLSIVNYSANAQASWGKGDIVMWSDTSGAYAGATISVSDINWDDGKNLAYYGKGVEPRQILTGKVSNPAAAQLQEALP